MNLAELQQIGRGLSAIYAPKPSAPPAVALPGPTVQIVIRDAKPRVTRQNNNGGSREIRRQAAFELLDKKPGAGSTAAEFGAWNGEAAALKRRMVRLGEDVSMFEGKGAQ